MTITIGKTDYPLKAGQGKEDPGDALNYTVPEGKYSLKIKAPSMNEQSHVLDIREGEAWGVVVMPTGGFLPMQLY